MIILFIRFYNYVYVFVYDMNNDDLISLGLMNFFFKLLFFF